MISELTFPERRMMEHERRRASHPHRPQTVWGTILTPEGTIPPVVIMPIIDGILSCLTMPVGELMAARGLMR